MVRERAVFKTCSCKPFPIFFFILTPSLEFEKHKLFLWRRVIFCHVPIILVFEEVTDILLICQQYPQRICEYRKVLGVNSSLHLQISAVSYSLVHTQRAHYIWMAVYWWEMQTDSGFSPVFPSWLVDIGSVLELTRPSKSTDDTTSVMFSLYICVKSSI